MSVNLEKKIIMKIEICSFLCNQTKFFCIENGKEILVKKGRLEFITKVTPNT